MYVFRDELTLKRLRRLATGSVAIALVIIAVFVGVLFNLTKFFTQSYHDIVHSLVRGDAVIISHLVKSDFNALNSLSMFISGGSFIDNYDPEAVGKLPSFITIGFCGTDGKCREVKDGAVNSFDLADSSPEFRYAVSQAISGINYLSEPYFSKFLDKEVLIAAAPVDGSLGYRVGAVFAARALSSYSEILRQSRVTGNERLYLINSKGTVIATSRTDGKIAEGDIFSDKVEDSSDLMLSLMNSVPKADLDEFQQYELNGPNGRVMVHSMSLNVKDWMLLYALNQDLSFLSLYRDVIVLGITLFIFLALIIGIGIYAYANLRRSTSHQQHLLSHDQLTGALNFSRFYYELQQIDFNRRSYALATFNVRDFRYINKFAGIAIGDLLLRTIYRVAGTLPNMCFVCRTDADHFYLLMRAESTDEATETLGALISKLQSNFSFIKLTCPLVCYAAVALSESSDNADTLIQKTQVAARYLEKKFDHTISVYDKKIQLEEQRLKGHEQRMRQALENHEFKLYLQGQFDLKRGRITRAEALVRWVQPDKTFIFPDQFISLFEQNGFSTELDLYMFDQACRTIRQWLDEGLEPVTITVNQTRNLLIYPDYVSKLKESLDRYHVPGRFLMIEMLEGEMATRLDQLNAVVEKLHDIGVRMALDDFGTGYSSLNVLSGMRLDEIKFDKRFLLAADPKEKERNRLILTQMMKIVQMFGMSSVVEGVESAHDVEFLKQIGCDYVQGFYFSKPIAKNDFTARFMQDRKVGTVSHSSLGEM